MPVSRGKSLLGMGANRGGAGGGMGEGMRVGGSHITFSNTH